MKIGVICNQRTRGSYFTDVISKYYNIPNLNESKLFEQVAFFRTKIPPIKSSDFLWQRYKTNLPKILEENQTNDFVIKVMPAILMNIRSELQLPTPEDRDNFFINSKNIITDFSILKLETYDKLFLLDRDPLDSGISHAYSNFTDSWLFHSKEEVNAKMYTGPVNLTLDMLFYVDMHLVSLLIQPYLEEFLKRNNVEYTRIEYDQIPIYVNDNFSSIQSIWVESEYKYKEIITNYSELENYINSRINSIKIKLHDIFK